MCLAVAKHTPRPSGPDNILVETINNTKMKLKCIRDDHEVKRATWTKDGHPVRKTERVKIKRGYLKINPVLPEDEGIYRCNEGEENEITGNN